MGVAEDPASKTSRGAHHRIEYPNYLLGKRNGVLG